ncbi:tyrosine-type recombinase/integrase [Stutzerimonas kunmingensis]|uniref:tyrosine-type recombinase/integrase n=1 Tax=Stutzerimonas kunmingensis TaxID=1211807 RepID=UPI0005F21DD1|nr:integrase family protein [Stutzerimonas kunmingensis]KJS23868.1 MAG: integrase [Pseudomonas sp. BRH_c35]
MANRITDIELRSLKGKVSEPADREGKRGFGTLLFERRPSGIVEAYYRQRVGSSESWIKLGTYKRDARAAGNTLAELRTKANEYAQLAAEQGDVKAHLAARALADDAEQKIRKRQAEIESRRGSFGELLDAYADSLERAGKSSADAVRKTFALHVKAPFADLIAQPAADVQPEDIQAVLAAVLSRTPKGRGRGNKAAATASNGMRTTADKVRRYLRAAFSHAAKAHLAPERIATDGKAFYISANPVRDIPVIEGTGLGITQSYSPAELGELLRYLDQLPERNAAIAKALIYFGGQRLSQFCAVPWDRVTDETISLFDTKGRKAQAWEHLLPITDRLKEIMQPLFDERIGPGPFALSVGKLAHPDTISELFIDAGRALFAEGKASAAFTWKNVRVSAETLMASQGIGKELRAWLLSHGRSGVQEKHYDRYSYLPEKRAALELWGRYLDRLASGEAPDNVVLLSKMRG